MTLSPIRLTTSDRHRLFLVVSQADREGTLDRDVALDLEGEIRDAEVVAPAEAAPDLITMRTTLRLTDLDSGVAEVYTIVYPQEVDLSQRKISVLSPVGTAVLGKRVGDVVAFSAPGGVRSVRLDEILFQPEAAGRYDL